MSFTPRTNFVPREWAEASLAPHAFTLLASMSALNDSTFKAIEVVLGGREVLEDAMRVWLDGNTEVFVTYPPLTKRCSLKLDTPSGGHLDDQEARHVAELLRVAAGGVIEGPIPSPKGSPVTWAAPSTPAVEVTPAPTPAKATWDKSKRTYTCFTCKQEIVGIDELYEHRQREHGKLRHGGSSYVAPAKTTAPPPVSAAFKPTLDLDLRSLPDGRFALGAGTAGLAEAWFVIKRTVKRRYWRRGRFIWGAPRGSGEYVEPGTIEVRVQRGDTKELIGEQKKSQEVFHGEQEKLLSEVLNNPGEAMALYGRLLGICAYCGRSLTDPLSRSRGIGPDCWEEKHIHTLVVHAGAKRP